MASLRGLDSFRLHCWMFQYLWMRTGERMAGIERSKDATKGRAVMQPEVATRVYRNLDRLEFTALIGVAVVGLLQLLQLEKLDIPLTLSLFCFAVGIPLL